MVLWSLRDHKTIDTEGRFLDHCLNPMSLPGSDAVPHLLFSCPQPPLATTAGKPSSEQMPTRGRQLAVLHRGFVRGRQESFQSVAMPNDYYFVEVKGLSNSETAFRLQGMINTNCCINSGMHIVTNISLVDPRGMHSTTCDCSTTV